MAESTLFSRRIRGYNRKQVDMYIEKISQAYQNIYDDNKEKTDKYDKLLEEFKMLETQIKTLPSAEVIAKVLIDAETLAKVVVDDAKKEAEEMRSEAAFILREAKGDAANITAEAERIYYEADSKINEATKINNIAKEKLERAHEIAEQAMVEFNSLLTFDGSDIVYSLVG